MGLSVNDRMSMCALIDQEIAEAFRIFSNTVTQATLADFDLYNVDAIRIEFASILVDSVLNFVPAGLALDVFVTAAMESANNANLGGGVSDAIELFSQRGEARYIANASDLLRKFLREASGSISNNLLARLGVGIAQGGYVSFVHNLFQDGLNKIKSFISDNQQNSSAMPDELLVMLFVKLSINPKTLAIYRQVKEENAGVCIRLAQYFNHKTQSASFLSGSVCYYAKLILVRIGLNAEGRDRVVLLKKLNPFVQTATESTVYGEPVYIPVPKAFANLIWMVALSSNALESSLSSGVSFSGGAFRGLIDRLNLNDFTVFAQKISSTDFGLRNVCGMDYFLRNGFVLVPD